MALVKVKKDDGTEVVMQRKVALEQELEIVSAPLDPANEADKPLIDAWMEANPVEEKGLENLPETTDNGPVDPETIQGENQA